MAETVLEGCRAEGLVTVRDGGQRGMVALKGDLAELGVAAEITGAEIPGPGRASWAGDAGLLWMAPDELMLIVPGPDAALLRLGEALAGVHHLAADVSDMRATLVLEGPACRDVLAKVTPADVSPAALPPDRVRRTRIGQVAAAFWFRDEARVELVCFRSVADYVFELLADAAREDATVGHHQGRP